MSITVEEPKIISLFYKPEPNDPNRGSCEWARFYFDLKNYVLSIESDCGNYSYGWVPTPNSESFLELCSRINDDYLLSKISEESVVDGTETFELIKSMVSEICEVHECYPLDDFEMEELERACFRYRNSDATYDAIHSVLRYSDIEDLYDSGDIIDSICMTYPNNAKKIVEVFVNEIQPYIKENLAELEGN